MCGFQNYCKNLNLVYILFLFFQSIIKSLGHFNWHGETSVLEIKNNDESNESNSHLGWGWQRRIIKKRIDPSLGFTSCHFFNPVSWVLGTRTLRNEHRSVNDNRTTLFIGDKDSRRILIANDWTGGRTGVLIMFAVFRFYYCARPCDLRTGSVAVSIELFIFIFFTKNVHFFRHKRRNAGDFFRFKLTRYVAHETTV